MVSGGLIIRLIDVVLIILLGFLTISDFSLKTQIKLPTGSGSSDAQTEIITIQILLDKSFRIFDDQDDIKVIRNLNTLETHLAAKQKKYHNKKVNLLIVVEPHIDTEIQRTVEVLDVCERLHVDKTISYPNIDLDI